MTTRATVTRIIRTFTLSILCFFMLNGNTFSKPLSVPNDSIPALIPESSPTIERKPILLWNKLSIPVNKYYIQIAGDSTFNFPLINVSVVDTTYTPDIDLPLGLTYWRVSIDLLKWSQPDSFTIIDGRIPVLIDYESPTIVRKPTLLWHTPPLPVSSFTIQVSSDSTFATMIETDTTSDTSYSCDSLLPLGNIYWRIQSDDAEASKFSSFMVEDGRIPTLIPYDSITFERKPTLRWKTPPVTVTSYNIQIAKDSLFNIDSLIVNDFATDTFYTCKADLPIGPVFWRIKSDNAEVSKTESFEIKDARIPLLYPVTPDIINSTQPTLGWHTVNGAQTYTIEIDNNSDFGSTIITLPLSDTLYTHFEPLPLGKIYWRVKSDQVDIWSDVNHFFIVTDTIPLIERFNGKVLYERKPGFFWHPVEKAESYQIKLATNKDFTNAITVPLEDTVYTSTTNLAYAKWFWKVSCSRNLEAYCPVDSFIIDSITAISNHSTIPQNDISFQRFQNCIRINGISASCRKLSLTVFDLHGRVITSVKPKGYKIKEITWDFTDQQGNTVPAGMYILHVVTDRKRYTFKTFMGR